MHTKHLTSPAQALYRVFVSPALSRRATSTTIASPQNLLPTSRQPLSQSRSPAGSQRSTRAFSTSPRHQSKTRAPITRKERWNEEIPSAQIYLINPTTGTVADPETGEYPPPVSKAQILASIDRQKQRLVEVAPGLKVRTHKQSRDAQDPFGEEGGSDEGEWTPIPVCKVVDIREAYLASKARQAAKKDQRRAAALSNSIKTLELNWAIDGNDLSHRLDRMRDFLEEGRKVEVVLAAKKRGRKATAEECKGVLEKIRRIVAEVDGAKEVAEMQGRVGGFVTLRFQGRPG